MNSDQAFSSILEFVFRIEGLYSNDPDDAGGETKFGISKRAHPDVDVTNLTLEQARKIYFEKYWIAFRCHQMPPVTAMLMFDAAVQHRANTAVTLMQLPAKNMLFNIVEDGVLGPKTLAFLEAANPAIYVPHHLSYRAEFYTKLISAKSSQAKYARGWMRRLFLLQGWLFMDGLLDKVVV